MEVDKLVLQLSADGADTFIRSLQGAQKQLQAMQAEVQKAAKDTGVFDRKKEDSQKKTAKREDKLKKNAAKNNNELTGSLEKMLKTMLAISGVSFGIAGLKQVNEKVSKNDNDLSKTAKVSGMSAQQLEGVKKGTERTGYDPNAIVDFLRRFSVGKSNYFANDPDMMKQLTFANSLGAGVDMYNDTPMQLLEKLNRTISKLDQTSIDKLSGAWGGFGDELANSLSSSKLMVYVTEEVARSNLTKEREEQNKENINTNQKLDGEIDNAERNLALSSQNITQQLKQLEIAGIKSLNQMVDWFNAFDAFWKKEVAVLAKDGINEHAEWAEEKRKGFDTSKQKVIEEKEKEISNIDKDRGIITFKDGSTYGSPGIINSIMDYVGVSPYLSKHYDKLLSGEVELPRENNSLSPVAELISSLDKTVGETQRIWSGLDKELLGNQSASVGFNGMSSSDIVGSLQYPNNTLNNTYHINELVIQNNDASNLDQIGRDVYNQTKFVSGNASSMMPFVRNIK